jgi:hypothetical protein
MAAKKTIEAAVDYFAARSHDAWRKQFHKTNLKERALPRLRMRGGKMVDINKPWKHLDPKAKAENKVAAYAAYAAHEKFPNDREKASDYVHKQWMKRNRADASQPKRLFKPYNALPEIEKDKDRAHVDQMIAALAAVRGPKALKKAAKKAASTLKVDARSAARLEAAAARLSTLLGRKVTAQALLAAGVEAVLAASEAGVPRARSKKKR